ncbi:hypothetical protein ABID93_004459, partial [Pseudomonas trivialis]
MFLSGLPQAGHHPNIRTDLSNGLKLIAMFFNCCSVAGKPALWLKSLLWRAGLPRVGVRSAPHRAKRGVPDTAQRLALGLLRSPTQDKPARHRES